MINFADATGATGRSTLVKQVEEIFSPTGLLAKAQNFEYRPEQQQMAVAVAESLETQKHLLTEAGTGVGKSLAYLIPSILYAVANSKKAIVCTHTINLQEQLTEKDLPMLTAVLPVKFQFAMLKGRGNYLCTRRLKRAMQQADSLFTSTEVNELRRIWEWSQETKGGSLSDFDTEPDMKVWSQVCSERGLCSPKLCGHASDYAKDNGMCFFQRARQRFLAADVLVLNHTLFFTLLGGVDEEVEGGILFRNDFLVFDEAHTVESVASKHIGLSVSSSQYRFALQRLWNPRTEKGLLSEIRQGKLIQLVAECLKAGDVFFESVEEACETLAQTSTSRGKPNAEAAGAAKRNWSEIRIRRPELVQDELTLPLQRLREGLAQVIKESEDKERSQELQDCNRRLGDLREEVGLFLSQESEGSVYWVERSGRLHKNLSLNSAPVNVADYLRLRLFGSDTSIIMTSATLAVPRSGSRQRGGGPLDYFASRIGGESARKLQVGSPFDYETQMKVYVVNKMPEPRAPDYAESVAHWVEHFVKLTHGKAFVLFTSFKMMLDVASRTQLAFEKLGLQCFVQGSGVPRSLMLEKFKEDIDSVLFGTDSFWQGVDVPGDALSNVIITRLPFAVPDHPLIEARIEDIESRGGNSFAEFSLPEAILKFRQGVGRLIRTKSDKGIVVVLDNRILTQRYGKDFLESIPKCPVEIV